jgi:eukaryotic translation initiation factor 2C
MHIFSFSSIQISIYSKLSGSMDAQCSRFGSALRVQETRQEIIQDLAGMMVELLRQFHTSTGTKPSRILFYRDGVSEGQFQTVRNVEVNAIRTACSMMEVGYRPTVTFVVVQKRHHTRFFPINRQETSRSGNVQPGTVVDTGITSPHEFGGFRL